MERQSIRPRVNFRLQTLLVLTTVIVIAVGLVSQELRQEQRKQFAIKEIKRFGGHVYQQHQPDYEPTGVINGWLRQILGNDHFSEVLSVSLRLHTADDVDLVQTMPELDSLSLEGDLISDETTLESLQKLRPMQNLQSLHLRQVKISDLGMAALANQPNFESLVFEDCELTENSLEPLSDFPNLSRLYFRHCEISARHLGHVARQTALKKIDFSDCDLTNDDLLHCHGVTSTVELTLHEQGVTEAAVLALREANPKWAINFRGNSANAPTTIRNFYPSVQEFSQAKFLGYNGPFISDATIELLKDASGLTHLSLDQCSVTSDGLQRLGTLKQLSDLTIYNMPISSEALRGLGALDELRVLNLNSTETMVDGLQFLPANLKELFIQTPVTNAGVACVAKLGSLEKLRLAGKFITDEAIDDFAKMKSLQTLEVSNCPITNKGLARLKAALPDCEIRVDR